MALKNPVTIECYRVLKSLGREVQYDKAGNLWSLGPRVGGEYRAIVAHNDSVMQHKGQDIEPVVCVNGVWRHKGTCGRPIGGDDKAGVAIALTIAATDPTISIILVTDEEVGCVGSSQIDIEYHDLMIQCDRKGASDLVSMIYGAEIASAECAAAAMVLLPWRKECDGALTDVLTFTERGMCGNAFNLSCGYYNPHTVNEYIVHSQVYQTLIDTYTLLKLLPAGMAPAERYEQPAITGIIDDEWYRNWLIDTQGLYADTEGGGINDY